MTRQEYSQVGAPLSERSNTYLEDCFDADIWAYQACSSIANLAALSRCGFMDPQLALHSMLALSETE